MPAWSVPSATLPTRAGLYQRTEAPLRIASGSTNPRFGPVLPTPAQQSHHFQRRSTTFNAHKAAAPDNKAAPFKSLYSNRPQTAMPAARSRSLKMLKASGYVCVTTWGAIHCPPLGNRSCRGQEGVIAIYSQDDTEMLPPSKLPTRAPWPSWRDFSRVQ